MADIRQAEKRDADLIIEFQKRMAKETEDLDLDSQTSAKGVKAVFNDPAKGVYYLAEIDNRPQASLMITYEWSDWRNAWVWWIQSVYVQPDYRKKGVFREMYSHIKQLAEQRSDVAGLRLYVDLNNKPANKVYEKIGMDGDHYRLFEAMKS